VDALRAAIAQRPEPKDEVAAPLVFITAKGGPWITWGQASPVGNAARPLLKQLGLDRARLGFATLRHVFRTIADGCRDQVAINLIMGHADPSMGAVYRERIDDARLRAVADYVHGWLWPKTSTETRVQ
jgi:integrase